MCVSFIWRKICVTLYHSGLLFNVNYRNRARRIQQTLEMLICHISTEFLASKLSQNLINKWVTGSNDVVLLCSTGNCFVKINTSDMPIKPVLSHPDYQNSVH